MIQAVIVVAVVIVGAVVLIVRAAGPDLPVYLAYGLGGAALIIVIAFALVKGATRHAVVAWSPPRRLTRDELLPRPAPRAIAAAPLPGRIDPFTADGPAWAELVEKAEREELLRKGPREARVIAPRCEGPGCAESLDDNPWKIRAEGGARSEEHSFCSRECAQAWQLQDSEMEGRR